MRDQMIKELIRQANELHQYMVRANEEDDEDRRLYGSVEVKQNGLKLL
jgi:hypothetical protein